MTSFIEVPAFFGDSGEELGSDYVNVDSIVVMRPDFGGEHTMIQTHGTTRMSYLPIGAFVAALDELTRTPGVHTWSADTKDIYRKRLAEWRKR